MSMPRIGDILHYHRFTNRDDTKLECSPCLVTRCNPDGTFNVTVFSQNGFHFNRSDFSNHPSHGKISFILTAAQEFEMEA